MFYALFVTVVISGEIHESQWKTFDRFEECWEAATSIVHNRPNMTARCVLVETKD
jgi:hypothetical protein